MHVDVANVLCDLKEHHGAAHFQNNIELYLASWKSEESVHQGVIWVCGQLKASQYSKLS